jgi:hypothetical protein
LHGTGERRSGLQPNSYKLFKISLWFGYLPIGILVYTFPHPTFDLLRYLFMLSGISILGWNYCMRFKNQAR